MADEQKLAVPTIHMNGTSAQELLRQQLAVLRAFNALEEAHAAASPNGRDYYPQGPDAFRLAQQQHQSRAERLRAIRKEYEQIAEDIA